MRDLKQVLKILEEENNLKLSIDKYTFMVNEINFLGCSIIKSGIKRTHDKINEYVNFPSPTDSKSLRRVLGMVVFYRKLIPHFASIVMPLTERMRLSPNEKKLQLTDDETQSFQTIKQTLTDLTRLPHPCDQVTDYQLVTDSSQYAAGAALHQVVNGNPMPIGFF